MKPWEKMKDVYYTQKFLLDKIEKLEKKLAYYENPCLFCGPYGWSTYVCDKCQEDD